MSIWSVNVYPYIIHNGFYTQNTIADFLFALKIVLQMCNITVNLNIIYMYCISNIKMYNTSTGGCYWYINNKLCKIM